MGMKSKLVWLVLGFLFKALRNRHQRRRGGYHDQYDSFSRGHGRQDYPFDQAYRHDDRHYRDDTRFGGRPHFYDPRSRQPYYDDDQHSGWHGGKRRGGSYRKRPFWKRWFD